MKQQIQKTLLAAAALLLVLPGVTQAQNHYPAGAEGIKAASLPPPGLYFRDYNFVYWADDFPGGPPDFEVFAYVNAPRLIWMTDVKILGANYGMDLIVPFGYTDVSATGLKDDAFGLGDIQFEPLLLSWHQPRWDFALAGSIWAPTGEFDVAHPAELGKGFWSGMFTAGATWYPDEKKTWSASILNRYEIHTEYDDLNVTPGDTYTLEFGLAKTVRPGLDLGLVGYWQQQVTDGQGDPSPDERVFALGPEIAGTCPITGLQVSLRYLREFDAKQRSEGNTVALTLTKRF